MPGMLDLAGQTFGRLKVIKFSHINHNKNACWVCECACGGEYKFTPSSGQLMGGNTRSCGCIKKDVNKEKPAHLTHGPSNRSEYRIWSKMKGRCNNPNNPKYKDYGARGIYVCDRWMESVENFIQDMGPRPSPKHSVERKDNNGPYAPWNCRWATNKEQQQNTRRTVLIEVNGVTKPLAAWLLETGASDITVRKRLRAGLSGESLFVPGRLPEHYYTEYPGLKKRTASNG